MPKPSMLRDSLSFLLIATALATGGCLGAGGGMKEYAGTGGTGSGSGGSGATSTYTPPRCDQTCQDYLVASGLDDTIWFLWNQKLAGHPSGTQDTSGSCPLGGTAHITGTDSVSSNGITTATMTFALAGCAHSASWYDLVFTGSVTMDGSFDGSTNYAAVTFDAPGLTTSGALEYFDNPSVTETCDVAFAQQGIGDGGSLDGRVCGRSFSSATALGAGAGGGSSTGGASGSTGGGTGSCRCFCPDGSDCTGATQANPCGVDSSGIPNVCGCPVGC